MKHYTSEQYRIEIFEDKSFTKASQNKLIQYDFVHFDESQYLFPSIYGIKIFQNDTLIKNAVIGSVGGGTTIDENSVIIERERLLVCCSDTIFCLSIPNLTLLWKTQADQATCIEIFKFQDSYIIHGEFEISRLDKNGNILWQQSGADIFTTLEGKDDFEITENYILATDWENRKYKFDFDGNIV
jgi:hypothetical protein